MSKLDDEQIEPMAEALAHVSEAPRSRKAQADVEADFQALAEDCGFPYYFCRIWVERQKSPREDVSIRITNYPKDWLDAYARSCQYGIDPIQKAFRRRFSVVALEDVSFEKLMPPQLGAESERFGVHFGFYVHTHNWNNEHGYLILAGMPAPSPGPEREFIANKCVGMISRVCEGGAAIADAGKSPPKIPKLSRRQWQVLSLRAAGYEGKRIASLLEGSPRRVDKLASEVIAKLGARNMYGAIGRAMALGLIDGHPPSGKTH